LIVKLVLIDLLLYIGLKNPKSLGFY